VVFTHTRMKKGLMKSYQSR